MSLATDDLPPVPQHTTPIQEDIKSNPKFHQAWLNWFIQAREKINLINSSIKNLSQLVAGGFTVKDEDGTWASRTITGTAGRISVDNGEGVLGDPVIDLVDTAVVAGVYGTSTKIPKITVGDDGRLTEVEEVTAAGGGGGARGYAAARLKSPGFFALNDSGGAFTTAACSPDYCYLQPFCVEREITLATMSINVTTNSAGATTVLGIYSNDDSGVQDVPGDLLVTTPLINTATTGYKTEAAVITLSPGIVYWSAIGCSNSQSYTAQAASTFDPRWLGRSTAPGTAILNYTFAPLDPGDILPATYTGTGTLNSFSMPCIWIGE